MKPCSKYEERISEMLFGEIPENESQKLHIHMAACDGCMDFYLSLYETLEAGEGEDFSLSEDQKKEIFDVAEKLDKPIKKLSPLWTTGVSIAASIVVSGVVIVSSSQGRFSEYKSREATVEIDVVMEDVQEVELEAPLEELSKSSSYAYESRNETTVRKRIKKEAPRKEAISLKQKKTFNYDSFGKVDRDNTPADAAEPLITTVKIENIETNDAALEDSNDESPSTDDNMLDQAVSDVVVSPSAFTSPSVMGGRSRFGRAAEKRESFKEEEESLDLVIGEKIDAGGGVGGLDAGEDDLVGGIGDVSGGEDLKPGQNNTFQNGHVDAGPVFESLEDDPFAEADPFAEPADDPSSQTYTIKSGDSISTIYYNSDDTKNNKPGENSKLSISNNIDDYEVVIESKFIETDQKNLDDFGFQWKLQENKKKGDEVGAVRLQNEFQYDEKNGAIANKILLERAKTLYADRRFIEAKGALEKVLTNEPYNQDSVELLQRTNRKLFESGRMRRKAQHQEYLAEVEWKWSDPINLYEQLGKSIEKDKPKGDGVLRENPEIVFHGLYLQSKELIKSGKKEEAKEQIKEAVRWAKSIAKTPDNEKRLGELSAFLKEQEMHDKAGKLKSEMERLKKLSEQDGSKVKVAPVERPMLSTQEKPMSTFSIDVDTASYQMAKQVIQKGSRPDPLSIRAEEFINSFDYKYIAPKNKAFHVQSEVVNSPFHRGSKIMKIGVQGKRPGGDHRAASHFCFIVDTSGSMADESRLPMVKKVLPMIVNQMSPGDKVSLVSCGLNSRLELDYVDVKNADLVTRRIQSLNAVGATNLEASLIDGYGQILKHTKKGTYSRVILFSDGVANLGEKNADNILQTLSHAKAKGAGITVIGMGEEEYNDNFLETLADKGDGNYVFIGNNKEARKTFEEKFAATFHTIAYNVKIQVEFDPDQVSKYRLLGYENRRLKNKDFRNDKVDAGEVGSGQSVTAIYELEMTGRPSAKPMAEVRLRYRDAVDNKMHEFATPVLQKSYNIDFINSSAATRLSLLSGKFAEVLRDGGTSEGITANDLLKYARPLASEMNVPEVFELLNLIEKSR